jgi:hypothetical protein
MGEYDLIPNPEHIDETEVPDFVMNIGKGPKLDGKTPKQRLPPYVFPPGVPHLDAAWERSYGLPVNDHDNDARKYARDNPQVWAAVVLAAQIEIAKGKRFSFRTIGEKIRWSSVPGFDKRKPYKLNNNYTPFFARYFRHFFPEVTDYIELRDNA